jgi:putative endonuclease
MVWVYILVCTNGSFYTGYTNNPKQRFSKHLARKVKYTASFKPVKLGACWQCSVSEKGPALALERAIKSLDHCTKQKLIQTPDSLSDFVADRINQYSWRVDVKAENIFNSLLTQNQQQS